MIFQLDHTKDYIESSSQNNNTVLNIVCKQNSQEHLIP